MTLAGRLRPLLLCAGLALAGRAQGQTFRFDNGFNATPGTLSFEYARETAAMGQDGSVLPPNQARYTTRQRLLCGAPVVRSEIPIDVSLGGALMAGATGVGPDGATQLLLVYASDPARLILKQLNANGTSSQVFQKETISSTGPTNLLRGEFSDREAEGIRYSPTFAFSICHGLVVSVCQVNVLNAGQWTRSRTAVCYWDMAAPQLGWRVVDPGPGDNTQPGLNRGSAFQMPGYTVLDPGPVLRAWFPLSDYVLNNQPTFPGNPNAYSNTGVFYLFNATRPAVGAPWTLGPLDAVYSPSPRVITPGTAILGLHAHPPFVERFGEHGLRMVCPMGDSWARNRVAVAYRSDEDYTSGVWPVYENLHGSSGTETDPSVGLGNQFVGSAALGTPAAPMGHVVGSDETAVPLARLLPGANPGDKLNFTRLYGQPTCSYNHSYAPARPYGWNTFHISTPSPESAGPYAALVLPGMQSGWMLDNTVPRVLFSRDGLTWGQAWATQDLQPWPARIGAGRIFSGSADRTRAFGLRSIPVPATLQARPLIVGDGGTNLLRGSDPCLAPLSVDAGNRVTYLTRARLAQRGLPPPPAAGAVYECTVGVSTPMAPSRRVATWQLTHEGAMTPQGPSPHTSAKVRAWLYPLPWNPATQPNANAFQANFSVGRYDNLSPGNPVGGAREEFVVGGIQTVGDSLAGWIPLTFDTDSSRWSSEPGFPPFTPSPAPFTLGLRIRLDTTTPVNPCAFLLAFESVQQGDTASYGAYPAAPAQFAQDQAAVTGFACGPDWAVQLAGEVPDDAWDQTLEPGQIATPLTLCTLRQDDDNHIQVIADPASRELDVIVTAAGQRSVWSARPRGDYTGRERFCFLRGSPVLLSLSQTGSKLSVCASVGGSTFATAEAPNPGLRPTRIVFADSNGRHPAAMNWYGGHVDTDHGLSFQAACENLASLQFLAK